MNVRVIRAYLICTLIASSLVVYAQDPAAEYSTKEIAQSNILDNRFEVGEELILTMKVDKYIMGDLFAVATKTGVALDFLNYAELLEFQILQKDNARIYEGWFLNQENSFILDLSDLNAPVVSINGAEKPIDTRSFQYFDDILYVEENVFYEWFQIKHEFRIQSLEFRVVTNFNFPFQDRLARLNRNINRFGKSVAGYPELTRAYGLLSPQVLDVQVNSTYRESSQDVNGAYSIIGARDVAFLHSNIFVSGTKNDPLSDATLLLSKDSLDADLLGFMGATKVEFGDVQPVRQGFTRNRSRGLKVTNQDIVNTLDIQKINLVGPIQVGWDVELYQNGTLINQATDITTGEYSFLDVELFVGQNDFDIVKYGPFGQVEREEVSRLVDRSLLDTSKLTYSVSITESNKSLFGVNDTVEEFDAGYNLSSDFRTSFKGISAGLSLQSDFGGDFSQQSASANLSTIIFDNWFATSNVSINDRSDYNSAVSLRGQIFDQSLSVQVGKAKSTSLLDANQVNNSSSLGINLGGDFDSINLKRLNYSVSVDQTKTDDIEQTQISGRLGYRHRNFGLFNNITHTSLKELNGIVAENTQGSVFFSTSIGPIFTRINASYSLNDSIEIINYALETDYSITNTLRTSLDFNYNKLNDRLTTRFSIGGQFENFNIFSNINYSEASGLNVGLNFNFSLSAQPLIYGDIYQTNRRISQSGSLSVRVFIDRNMNGKFDIGEQLLEGVQVLSKQSVTKAFTDELGIAILTNLSNGLLTDIELDVDTLPSPILAPRVKGVSIRARSGYADSLDFPVAPTTEIEGLVSYKVDDKLTEASKIKLQLVNQRGDIVQETNTEFDGYYVFNKVFVGKYKIQLSPEVSQQKNLHVPVTTWIDVDPFANDYIVNDIVFNQKSTYEGFVSRIFKTDSQRALNLYLKLNKKRLQTIRPMLKVVNDYNQITLIAGFDSNKSKMEAQCVKVNAATSLKCEAVAHTMYH